MNIEEGSILCDDCCDYRDDDLDCCDDYRNALPFRHEAFGTFGRPTVTC